MLKGNYGTVKIMLSNPSKDFNCKDKECHRTLVSSATNSVSEFDLEQLLFLVQEKKADVNIADLKDQTPLYYACDLVPKQLCQKHVQNFAKLRLFECKERINVYPTRSSPTFF